MENINEMRKGEFILIGRCAICGQLIFGNPDKQGNFHNLVLMRGKPAHKRCISDITEFRSMDSLFKTSGGKEHGSEEET